MMNVNYAEQLHANQTRQTRVIWRSMIHTSLHLPTPSTVVTPISAI